MDAVVLDAEARDAGALALARLELDQELAGVRPQGAQLVQVRVESGGDHAPVAHHRGGLFGDRACEEVENAGGWCECRRELR